MAIAPKKINYDVAIKSTNHTRSYSLPPEVYTSDTAVQFRFNILDVEAAEFTEGAAVSTVEITTRDGSFFQHVGETSLEGTTVVYDLKEAEGNHAGLAKIQLKINLGGDYFTSDEYEFKILNSIATGVPVEIYVQNWDTLTAQANAYLTKMAQDIEDFDVALETGVLATNIAAKLIELQTSYAPRLLSVEQRLEQAELLISKKVGDGKLATMADVAQDIKTAMTGGSVAVVGENVLLEVNVVDKQITPRKMTITEERGTKNLINEEYLIGGKYINSVGVAITTGYAYSVTDFTDITGITSLYGIGINEDVSYYLAFYDAGRVFISSIAGGAGAKTYAVPVNAVYVRSTIKNNVIGVKGIYLGNAALTYTGVQQRTSQLKSMILDSSTRADIDNLKTKSVRYATGKNLFDKSVVTTGFIDANGNINGWDIFRTSRHTFVKGLANITISGCNGVNTYIEFSDAYKKLLYLYPGTTAAQTLAVPSDAVYVRFSFAVAGLATAQLESGAVATTYETYYTQQENTATLISTVIDGVKTERSANLFDKTKVVTGNLNVSGGLGGNGDFRASDYIDVFGFENIFLENNKESGVYHWFYDANKALLSSVSGSSSQTQSFPVPVGAYYLRITTHYLYLDTKIVCRGYVSQKFVPSAKMVDSGTITPVASEIVLPDTLFVAKNIDANIYHDNIVLAPNDTLKLYCQSTVGKDYKRLYKYKPTTTAADTSIFVQAIDDRLNLVAQKKVTLKTVDTAGLTGTRTILAVGDSFTDLGHWLKAISDNLTAIGITPNFIGKDTSSAGVKCEALSGGKLSQFVTNTVDNPWWNTGTSANDIVTYLSVNGFAKPDYLLIQFTWNDIQRWGQANYNDIVANIKVLCDAFRLANPTGKVIFSIEPSGADRYNNVNTIAQKSGVLTFAKTLFAAFNGTGDYSYVRIAPSYAFVDPINGYNYTTVAFDRFVETESVVVDAVHCNVGGMQQIGDCVTSMIVAIEKGLV